MKVKFKNGFGISSLKMHIHWVHFFRISILAYLFEPERSRTMPA